jgi:hypothetical protein
MWEHRPLGVVFACSLGKRRKTLDDGDTPGSTGTLSRSRSGQAVLRGSSGSGWRMNTTGKKPSNGKQGETSHAKTSERKEL